MKLRAFFFSVALLLVTNSSPSFGYVLGPTTPGDWGGPGAHVTWSIMGPGLGVQDPVSTVSLDGLSGITLANWQAQITAAFAAWSSVANITFSQVADCNLAQSVCGTGHIRIGAHAFDGPSGVIAHGFFPPDNGGFAAGDIHLDSAELWKIGFGGPGFNIFQVMAHEIGHAIGLNHVPDGQTNALMNRFYTEAFSGPQADDIAGARFLYGPAVIPIPAALPLFGSAVVVMGLVGWRRQKKSSA